MLFRRLDEGIGVRSKDESLKLIPRGRHGYEVLDTSFFLSLDIDYMYMQVDVQPYPLSSYLPTDS